MHACASRSLSSCENKNKERLGELASEREPGASRKSSGKFAANEIIHSSVIWLATPLARILMSPDNLLLNGSGEESWKENAQFN